MSPLYSGPGSPRVWKGQHGAPLGDRESTRRLPSSHETKKHEKGRKGRQVISRLGQVLIYCSLGRLIAQDGRTQPLSNSLGVLPKASQEAQELGN